MTARASTRLADARVALHALLDSFEREGVHAKLDAVRALVALADRPAADDGAAVDLLAQVRAVYDGLRGHQDGIDDVYFPRPDHGEQVRVNRELDSIRAAVLTATDPASGTRREQRRAVRHR